jgi:hypothetical protein
MVLRSTMSGWHAALYALALRIKLRKLLGVGFSRSGISHAFRTESLMMYEDSSTDVWSSIKLCMTLLCASALCEEGE